MLSDKLGDQDREIDVFYNAPDEGAVSRAEITARIKSQKTIRAQNVTSFPNLFMSQPVAYNSSRFPERYGR